MTRHALDQQMREVLAELEICSHVPAPAYEPRGRSRGKNPGGDVPPGDWGPAVFAQLYGPPFYDPRDQSLYDETLDIAYDADIVAPARDDRERSIVIQIARDELNHIRGHDITIRPTGETLAEFYDRVAAEGAGLTVAVACVYFRCGPRQIKAARIASGLNPDNGLEPPVERLAATDRRRRARELSKAGKTIAQIARELGAHRSTVERDLGRRPQAEAA